MRKVFDHRCDARCYGDETAAPSQRKVEIASREEFDKLVTDDRAGKVKIRSLQRGKNGVIWIATVSEHVQQLKQATLL